MPSDESGVCTFCYTSACTHIFVSPDAGADATEVPVCAECERVAENTVREA